MFFGEHTKNSSSCGRKFSGKFGEILEKILRTPKNLSLAPMASSSYALFITLGRSYDSIAVPRKKNFREVAMVIKHADLISGMHFLFTLWQVSRDLQCNATLCLILNVLCNVHEEIDTEVFKVFFLS